MFLNASFKIGLSLATAQVLLMASAASANPTVTAARLVQSASTLADGVYLYGEASQRDQIGSVYLIFEVENEQAIGAFYMPGSSFDCFYGSVTPDALDVTVVDSYEQTHHAYSVAMQTSEPIAAGAAAGNFGPIGFNSISEVSAQDQQILNTCQADFEI